MRGSKLDAAARAAAVALAIGSVFSPISARGATKHHVTTPPPSTASFAYNTTGAVEIQAAPASVAGPALLQFQGVTNGIYTPASGQPIQLGEFVLPASATTNGLPTTYTGTPFVVEIKAPEFDKTSQVPLLGKAFPKLGNSLHLKSVTLNSLLLRGHLDGTVSPAGQSNVVATVDSIKLGGLEAHTMDHVTRYTFPIRFGALKLPPSWAMSPTQATNTARTPTTAAAQMLAPSPAAEVLSPTPTPEPSTLVVFAVALGGLALARRRGA